MPSTPYTTTASVGNQKEVVLNFSYLLSSISAADILTDYVVPFAFKVINHGVVVTSAVTTGSKAATLTPKIDGTAITGSALALTSAGMTPLGKYQAVTVTDVLSGGNNIAYAAGSKISVTASSVTAFAEGSVTYFITLQVLD